MHAFQLSQIEYASLVREIPGKKGIMGREGDRRVLHRTGGGQERGGKNMGFL